MTLAVSASVRGMTAAEARDHALAFVAKDAEAAFLRHAVREQYAAVRDAVPAAGYDESSGLIVLSRPDSAAAGERTVAVVAAGTTDLPVAAEAAAGARAFGFLTETVNDVGVAGLHRLLAVRPLLERADVLIVVAGMEGALPSMVTRMCDKPVIAVPTSVGYGASYGGVAALLAMLTANAPGMAVTGIDDGLSAAVIVRRFL